MDLINIFLAFLRIIRLKDANLFFYLYLLLSFYFGTRQAIYDSTILSKIIIMILLKWPA